MADEPTRFSVPVLLSVPVPERAVPTVSVPVFVAVTPALIKRLAREPVPLMVCAAVVCSVTVTVVLVRLALMVSPPVLVSTPAAAPVILPPALMVMPPAPMLVVRAFAQSAVPLITKDKALPGLSLIVTIWPAAMVTVSAGPGIPPGAPPHPVAFVPPFPFSDQL